jgi:hypothetical protein
MQGPGLGPRGCSRCFQAGRFWCSAVCNGVRHRISIHPGPRGCARLRPLLAASLRARLGAALRPLRRRCAGARAPCRLPPASTRCRRRLRAVPRSSSVAFVGRRTPWARGLQRRQRRHRLGRGGKRGGSGGSSGGRRSGLRSLGGRLASVASAQGATRPSTKRVCAKPFPWHAACAAAARPGRPRRQLHVSPRLCKHAGRQGRRPARCGRAVRGTGFCRARPISLAGLRRLGERRARLCVARAVRLLGRAARGHAPAWRSGNAGRFGQVVGAPTY